MGLCVMSPIDHAVFASQARIPGKIVVRNRTDPDQNRITLQDGRARNPDARHLTVEAIEPLDHRAEVKAHAVRFVNLAKEVREHRSGHPGQQPILALDNMDVDAEFAGGGRNLKPDITTTDNRQSEAWLEPGLDRLGVLDGPQFEEALEVAARQAQTAGPCAGRQDEGVVGQDFVSRQRHAFGGPIDADHARRGSQRDV